MEGAFSFGRKMISGRNGKKNAASTDRLQQKPDTVDVATQFPQVAGIVVKMQYRQGGIGKELGRTVHFFPSSPAPLIVACLSKDCIGGGFDLTPVIAAMVRKRKASAKGDLSCEGEGASAGHSSIVYEVAIKYS